MTVVNITIILLWNGFKTFLNKEYIFIGHLLTLYSRMYNSINTKPKSQNVFGCDVIIIHIYSMIYIPTINTVL